MKHLKWIFLGFIVYILAGSLFQNLRFYDSIFNAGIILAVVATSLFGLRQGLLSTITFAVLTDFFTSRVLGINLLIFFILIFIIDYIVGQLYKNSVTMPLILFSLSTVLFHLLYLIIMFLFQSIPEFSVLLKKIMIELIYNILIGYLVYYIIFKNVRGHRLGEENV